jgi:hypothetical protein
MTAQWRLEDRRGTQIAAGTLEQMLTFLKCTVQDGEYQLVGPETTIMVRRHRGVVYPFDRWKGWQPWEVMNQRLRKS